MTVNFIQEEPLQVIFTTNGLPGIGIPAGGTTGQILAKVSDTSYDTEWIDPPSGGSVVLGLSEIGFGNSSTGLIDSDPNILAVDNFAGNPAMG